MRTLYYNGITLSGKPINFIVDNDKIVKSSNEYIDEQYDESIDLQSKLVIPGLIDLMEMPDILSEDIEKNIAGELKSYIKGGITNLIEYPEILDDNVNSFDIIHKIIEIKNKYSKINFNIGNFFNLNDDINKFTNIVYSIFTKIKLPKIDTTSKEEIVGFLKKLDEIAKKENLLVVSMNDENIDTFFKYFKNKEVKVAFTDVITSKEFNRIQTFKEHGYNFFNIIYIDSFFINKESCINEVFEKKYRYCKRFTTKEDSKFFIRMLREDKIDFLIPHHYPMSIYDKMERYKIGNPNSETFIPLLIDLCKLNRIPLSHLENSLFEKPKRILECSEILSLDERSLASFAVFDLSKMWFVKNEDILSNAKWTPYENKQLWCVVDRVVINGKEAYKLIDDENNFTTKEIKTRNISTKKIESLFED